MKDLNKRTDFDKYWEEVFQDAEMTPSDNVWNKIDSSLSKEEAGYFKRKAFIFKLMAAASIVFAMSVGLFSLNYYLENGSGSPVIVSDANDGIDTEAEQFNPDNSISIQPDQSLVVTLSEKLNDPPTASTAGANEGNDQNLNSDAQLDRNYGTTEGITTGYVATIPRVLNAQQEIHDGAASEIGMGSGFLNTSQIDELRPLDFRYDRIDDMAYDIEHIYLIPIMPRGASKMKRESDTGMLTASLDVSAGSFNPNFVQGGMNFASPNGAAFSDSRSELAAFNTANKDFLLMRNSGKETKSQLAISYGVNVGFKITNRFLLQTGVAYRKANTTTTTNGYIENPDNNTRIPIVATYNYQFEGLSSVNLMEQTDLNNQYEFASIPVRMGYMVLDRKVSVTLLAGMTSEFFINNTIEDKSNFLQTLSSNDAADTPYNNVYFNGSFGTMIGYTFAGNYMMTVEPGYRMALSSFTKDNFYLNSFPSSFMLTFGLAYNFK
jgi:hypothetical protein